MTKKKNKFFTFCISLMPGAGEMFLGFYKQGISIMVLFFLSMGIAGFLDLSLLMYACPILWFYSFFHTNNINSLPDDEFYAIDDDYILDFRTAASTGNSLITKHRHAFAILLIVLGISILWNIINNFLFHFLFRYLVLPEYVYALMKTLSSSIPQGLVGIAIVMAGYYLIRNKKEALDQEENL